MPGVEASRRALLACLVAAPLALLSAAVGAAAPRPSFVVILADDMGYSDLGSYGGEIEATNPWQALRQAMDAYGEDPTFVWWIIPEEAIHRSQEDDVESMFSPAVDKRYRMPQDYRVVREMLEVRRQGE